MKCLSLTQPWASLVAVGEKHYETRGPTFPRRHRGELAIASSLGFPADCRALARTEPFRTTLARAGLLSDVGTATSNAARQCLPLGVILCVVEVVEYVDAGDVSPSQVHPRCYSWRSAFGDQQVDPAANEHHFGDYSDGRTIILMRNVRPLRAPVPVERIRKGIPTPGGALGIYELSPGCVVAVRNQLGRAA